MALKAVHVSPHVPNFSQVPDDNATFRISSKLFNEDDDGGIDSNDRGEKMMVSRKFLVMGHRGSGMNMLQSADGRMKAIKENSIFSFNAARKFNLEFIEFDVQVTQDDCPVVFHDNFILTTQKGSIVEKRVADLTLEEFLSYGPQRGTINKQIEKPLFRKTKDGRVFEWKVENDDPLCSLQEVFERVDHSSGFNIEFKFDDKIIYKREELVHVVQVVLQVVFKYAKDRPIILSSFQPDAALLIRKLQSTYPVYFLTNGGSEIFTDLRRNSLDEAIKLCLAGGLNGIVSEVKAVLRDPGAIPKIKESNLSLISYGQLNNVQEVVYMQYLMGVDGVIVDLVQEISEAVLNFNNPVKEAKEDDLSLVEGQLQSRIPNCSQHELSLLSKLIPGLIQT
ncbi:hypothetical protein RJ639_034423 [Escallonia herrerae]|uniref:glycerophosphodiester phosphodiesterase n=1 Tax=Escallonia herrerae TaxID=1293975 RepID=A0AA89BAN9_9ASTE|nr:hypothetical protein RJ639_034423 [Escallonia herrerae]